MFNTSRYLKKNEIAQEILAYLSEHPAAKDTLDGIVRWWLLERKIHYQVQLIREVLDDLVVKGVVSKKRMENNESVYSVSRH